MRRIFWNIFPFLRTARDSFLTFFRRSKGLPVVLDLVRVQGIPFGAENFCIGSSLLGHHLSTIRDI